MREKLLWVCWPPWVAITKYHKLVAKITEVYFHSSRGSEVQDQGTSKVGFILRPLSLLHTPRSHYAYDLYVSCGKRKKKKFISSSYKAASPIGLESHPYDLI